MNIVRQASTSLLYTFDSLPTLAFTTYARAFCFFFCALQQSVCLFVCLCVCVCVYIARQSPPSDRLIRLHSLPKLAFTTYARAFAFFFARCSSQRSACLFVCLCVCTSLDKAPLRVALYVCIHHARSRVCFFMRVALRNGRCVYGSLGEHSFALYVCTRFLRSRSLRTLALATSLGTSRALVTFARARCLRACAKLFC